jgi:hypothetical protein
VMAILTDHFKSEHLRAGLLLRDLNCGDLGILIKRYNILDTFFDIKEEIWVWDIYWTGPATNEKNKNTVFVEIAILTLLNSGAWQLQVENDDG